MIITSIAETCLSKLKKMTLLSGFLIFSFLKSVMLLMPKVSQRSANMHHWFTYDCCTNKALLTPHLKKKTRNLSHVITMYDKIKNEFVMEAETHLWAPCRSIHVWRHRVGV